MKMYDEHFNPNLLFSWAAAYCIRTKESPTLKKAARKFKRKIGDIITAVEDYQGDGYMGVAIGYRCANGVYHIEHKGDYILEAYA